MNRVLLFLTTIFLNESANSAEGGMPQLNPEFFASQLFWLVITFVFLFIFLWRISLPRINSVQTKRENKIKEDIKKAKRLQAEAEDIQEQINKQLDQAKSDSAAIPDNLKALEKKPEAFNLLNIYSEISKTDLEKVLNEMSGKDYSHVKEKLTDLLINEICPVGKEIKKLMDDKTHLLQILKKGSEKARIIAEENLKNIREKVGLL